MKSSKTMMGDCQMAFAFVSEVIAASYVRPAVLSLSRCHKAGADKAVSYLAWLEWATGLNGGQSGERCFGPQLLAFGGGL